MELLTKIAEIDRLFTEQKENISEPGDLKKILINYSFSLEELKPHLLYPEDLPYGRNCIFSSENFEVVVMNWKPGEASNIHDHGQSFGCVLSISGKATNVLYNEHMVKIDSVELINKEIAEVPQGIFHQIANPGKEFAVSLHFYAPPLIGMRVIDKENLYKSYVVKNNCGAWNPAPEEILNNL